MPSPCDSPRQAALAVITTLRTAGHTAYLAGGCVRDALLGLAPKDYDVATDATPDTVQQLFPSTAAVGAAFGVVLVYITRPKRGEAGGRHTSGGRHTIEVATFRADGNYADGRRPDTIRFTTAEEDAQRRDFTINGLFADPQEGGVGEDKIIDFVGGQDDLKQGVIRAIGDPSERFGEDYLRMLRAVRFAARFDFSIEPTTQEAIKQHAPKLDQIARERIGDEVRRMLMGPPNAPAIAQQLLVEMGLAQTIFGQPIRPITGAILPELSADADYATRLVALLSDYGLQASATYIESARDSLMLSNDDFAASKATCLLWQKIDADWDTASVAQRKRIATHERFAQMMLIWCVLMPEHAPQVEATLKMLAHDGIGLAPTPLITGDDLIALGLAPGPHFKTILDHTYDAQLEGKIKNTDQAIAFAQRGGSGS